MNAWFTAGFARWFKDAPIKRKLMLIGLLTTGLALLLVSFILIFRGWAEWRDRTVYDLSVYSEVIGSSLAPALMFDDPKAATGILSALSANPDIVDAVVYTQDGGLFARYTVPGHSPEMPVLNPDDTRFTLHQLIVTRPVRFKGETLGTFYLESNLSSLRAGLLRDTVLTLIVALSVFVAAIALFARMQKVIVDPIRRLTERMQCVSDKRDYAVRVDIHGKDEVGLLARTFNAMLERIQSRDVELRQHREHLEYEVARRTATLTEAQRIAHLGNWEWDIASGVLHWSDEIYRIFGLVPQQFAATYEAFLNAVHPQDRALVEAQIRESLQENQPYRADHRIVWPDGTVRYVHEQGEVVRNADGRPIKMLGTVQDITERRAAEEQIQFLAYHDALTRLPNRLLIRDHFELAVATADRTHARVALLFLDLDGFKTINDSLGHDFGDATLKHVAGKLRESLRDTDTLSRQGGDEFLIVLPGVGDTDSISVIADKILGKVAEPFTIHGHALTLSASMGIAIYPGDGNDFDTLLKKADTAMYHAKEAGRNTYRFHTEQMNIDVEEHLRMLNGLRQALARGEFVLHYQPQTRLASGAVIGAEALLRWRHPELGMIPPGRFIPVAEDSGLIVRIGGWVLREACRQAVAWQRAGLPDIVIAVNLSALQFRHGDLEADVIRALTESGLAPAQLELELTESILIQDVENVVGRLQRLKSLGIKLSIDDFGTGYSSLSYLKRFNVDKLKIDQSFVRDMVDNPNDAAIVQAIIQMARSLNLKTIAEGVENEHQLALLRLQHCDEVQGYYFARPMPAEDFLNYVTGNCATRR